MHQSKSIGDAQCAKQEMPVQVCIGLLYIPKHTRLVVCEKNENIDDNDVTVNKP